ncbi:MAG: tetratricopeptide repeat protein [Planctomycetes bacterium]|nr:tetratricopeptide repeat protein [Planctomycetota bacterium]
MGAYLPLPLLFLAAAFPAAADTIVLANGNELRGEIIEEGADVVRVRMPYGVIEVPRSEIVEIRRESPAETLLGQAEELAGAHVYDLARRLAEQALAVEPESVEVRERVANVLLRQGRYLVEQGGFDGAERAFERAGQLGFGDQAAEGLVGLRGRRREVEEATAAARRDLAAGRADEAAEAVERLLARSPGFAIELADLDFEAHVARGDSRFQAMDPTGAFTDYDHALAAAPRRSGELEDRWTAALGVRVYRDSILAGKPGDALAELARGEESFPGNRFLAFLSGLALEELDRDPEAYAAYRRALGDAAATAEVDSGALDAVREEARRSLGLSEGFVRPVEESRRWREAAAGDWQTIPTAHFMVHHRNPYAGDRVAVALERELQRIGPGIAPRAGERWPGRCEVFVYADRDAYQEGTGQPVWSGGLTETRFLDRRLSGIRISTYQTARELLSSVLPHELTHALLAAEYSPGTSLPRWLEEGLAVRSEAQAKRAYLARIVRLGISSGAIEPLRSLVARDEYPSDPASVDLFYGESYTLVDYLEANEFLDLPRLLAAIKERPDQGLPSILAEFYPGQAPADDSLLEQAWSQHVHEMDG